MSALVDRITEVVQRELNEALDGCYDDEGNPQHPYVPLLAARMVEQLAEAFDKEPRDWTIPELARLSRLHLEYEQKSDAHKELLPTASELSQAVGRFVAARGFRAAVKDRNA